MSIIDPGGSRSCGVVTGTVFFAFLEVLGTISGLFCEPWTLSCVLLVLLLVRRKEAMESCVPHLLWGAFEADKCFEITWAAKDWEEEGALLWVPEQARRGDLLTEQFGFCFAVLEGVRGGWEANKDCWMANCKCVRCVLVNVPLNSSSWASVSSGTF